MCENVWRADFRMFSSFHLMGGRSRSNVRRSRETLKKQNKIIFVKIGLVVELGGSPEANLIKALQS